MHLFMYKYWYIYEDTCGNVIDYLIVNGQYHTLCG